MDLIPIYKLLSDETRLRVLFLIYQTDLCVCELCYVLQQPQPKISKILSKLRDMNLVQDLRQDKFVFYHLKKENPLLVHNLNYLHTHLSDHPTLYADAVRLAQRRDYTELCSTSKGAHDDTSTMDE